MILNHSRDALWESEVLRQVRYMRAAKMPGDGGRA